MSSPIVAISPMVASLDAALSDGRPGSLLPEAEAICRIKLDGAGPRRHLAGPLTRLVDAWPDSRTDELMPWKWASADKS